MSLIASIAATLPWPVTDTRTPLPTQIMLDGRPLQLRLTRSARRALAAQPVPLDIEMELLFSCFVAKQLHFQQDAAADVAGRSRLHGPVSVSYRVSLTRVCDTGMRERRPARETLPVEHPQRYIPKWLSLDYVDGAWRGEFGY